MIVEPAFLEGLEESEAVRCVGEQLPEPASLPSESWIAVRDGRPPPTTLGRVLGRRPRGGFDLAVRCTALLARGYVDVRVDDAGIAWGRKP
jgi:hypothetical protein